MISKDLAKTITIVIIWVVLIMMSLSLINIFPPYVIGILYIIIAIFILFGVVATAYIILF